MPRESIQITGLHFETSSRGIVTVTMRTPDNASVKIFESIDDVDSRFIGAQELLKLKRAAVNEMTKGRLRADQPAGE